MNSKLTILSILPLVKNLCEFPGSETNCPKNTECYFTPFEEYTYYCNCSNGFSPKGSLNGFPNIQDCEEILTAESSNDSLLIRNFVLLAIIIIFIVVVALFMILIVIALTILVFRKRNSIKQEPASEVSIDQVEHVEPNSPKIAIISSENVAASRLEILHVHNEAQELIENKESKTVPNAGVSLDSPTYEQMPDTIQINTINDCCGNKEYNEKGSEK